MVLGYPKPENTRPRSFQTRTLTRIEAGTACCKSCPREDMNGIGWPWLGLSCLGKDIFSHLVDGKGILEAQKSNP